MPLHAPCLPPHTVAAFTCHIYVEAEAVGKIGGQLVGGTKLVDTSRQISKIGSLKFTGGFVGELIHSSLLLNPILRKYPLDYRLL